MLLSPFNSSDILVKPEWLFGSEEVPGDTQISFTLQVPDEVVIGDPVPLKMSIRNNSNEDIVLRYRNYRRNFAIADAESGELIWSLNRLDTFLFDYKSPLKTLEAGESITLKEKWTQGYGEFYDKYESGKKTPRRDEEKVGRQVPSGSYEIYAIAYFYPDGEQPGDADKRHNLTGPKKLTIIKE